MTMCEWHVARTFVFNSKVDLFFAINTNLKTAHLKRLTLIDQNDSFDKSTGEDAFFFFINVDGDLSSTESR